MSVSKNSNVEFAGHKSLLAAEEDFARLTSPDFGSISKRKSIHRGGSKGENGCTPPRQTKQKPMANRFNPRAKSDTNEQKSAALRLSPPPSSTLLIKQVGKQSSLMT